MPPISKPRGNGPRRCRCLTDATSSPRRSSRLICLIGKRRRHQSVSVLDHILEERPALAELCRLLAPDGALLLTLPCAAAGYDQYRDYDDVAMEFVR
jgi:hypothetical protein